MCQDLDASFDACINGLHHVATQVLPKTDLHVSSSSMPCKLGWSKEQRLAYVSHKIALYYSFSLLFWLPHNARDIGCASSQARLARQLKEAMAERQMAKSESKALHTQLDKLQKQVCVHKNTCLWVLHGPLDVMNIAATVHHCQIAWLSQGMSFVVVKQLTAGMTSGDWQETCYSCNVMRRDAKQPVLAARHLAHTHTYMNALHFMISFVKAVPVGLTFDWQPTP